MTADSIVCIVTLLLVSSDLLNFEKYGQNSIKEGQEGGILGDPASKLKKSKSFHPLYFVS